ncbi:glutaredoxin family protein [Nocardioides caldifontis]|uniref:glutaredoxin family protein n=1 Tax=Nocardioides caldifontis TaxID=2588938 RepID=UPI0011DF3700
MTGHPTGQSTGQPTDEPRVVLYGRPGCHLCDDAREVVTAVCDGLGERWVEVDITTDPALESRFGEEVPVTFVDGRQHDFWRVDAARLTAALRPPESSAGERRTGRWRLGRRSSGPG